MTSFGYSYDLATTIKVKEASFLKFHLESIFKSINRKNLGDEIEFLNVLHVIAPEVTGTFITKTFTKSTAENRCFLNCTPYVYKQINRL